MVVKKQMASGVKGASYWLERGTIIWQRRRAETREFIRGPKASMFTRNMTKNKLAQEIRQGAVPHVRWHSEKEHSQTPQRFQVPI